MNHSHPPVYIAAMETVTALGPDRITTAAAVKAGISAYGASEMFDQHMNPVSAAFIDDELFNALQINIDEGSYYSAQHDRTIKMSHFALTQILTTLNFKQPVPLILALAEAESRKEHSYTECLIRHLLEQENFPFVRDKLRCVYTGRSAGIEAIDLAFRVLTDTHADLVMIGGIDSYYQAPRLGLLENNERLLSASNSDGFAPGEGAGFILLTTDPAKALQKNGCVFRVYSPGLGNEPGHLSDEAAYLGDGLADAFKKALAEYCNAKIRTIYSSMNGERYWAKELGVAMSRSHKAFVEDATVQHPADCLGDTGAACAIILTGIALEDLASNTKLSSALIYASADGPGRAAMCLEKIEFNRR